MKKRRLSILLLRNYVMLFIIMTIIFTILTIATAAIGITCYIKGIDDLDSNVSPAVRIRKDSYKDIDAGYIKEMEGWVEILDKDYKVINVIGNAKIKREKYLKEEFYSYYSKTLEFDVNKSGYTYSCAYNKSDDTYIFVIIPNEQFYKFFIKEGRIKPKLFIKISLSLYFLAFVVSIFIYSKLTAKTFTKPLKKLLSGVRRISAGDYSARIELNSKSEFDDLSEAFNHMAEKIQREKNINKKHEEDRRKLIVDISHDLKNPLSSVLGYSEYILNYPDITREELDKYLSVIQNNSLRANTLIKDLFEFSKLESKDFKLQLKTEDICEFLRLLIAGYISEFEANNIEYNFVIPEKAINASIDWNNLERAIGNIIFNCIKYNKSGTSVEIQLKEEDENCIISIKDNGIGIPKNFSKVIFEPFVRVDIARNSKSGGTGLGLAITKAIIEKHGGSISLDSNVGEGCSFKICIPKV